MNPPERLRALPVWLVVRRAFSYAWESRAALWAPYAIFTALTLAADMALDAVGVRPVDPLRILVEAASEVFAMAFAVGIHRFVLLGEAPRGVRFFRWDKHLVQYVLTALALVLAGALALIFARGIAKGLGESGGAAAFGAVFLAVSGVLIASLLCRVSLMLPSAALGDLAPTRLVWRATHGNGPRLLGATMLVVGPFIAAQFLILWLLRPPGQFMPGSVEISGLAGLVATAAVALISPLQLIVLTMALALEYDFLVRGRGPAQP
jgi:hypothetical protein